jgi:alcohol dehydrogenase (cytochrome c)
LCGLAAQITYQQITAARTEPGNWLTYSGDYAGHRYCSLRGIDRANVARLRPAWICQTNDLNPFEAVPIVAGGVMYISEPPSNGAAFDLPTGRPLWLYRRAVPSDVGVCCGQVNRGVAVLDGRVFLGTLDAHLLSLDAKTGHLLWYEKLADYRQGYSITAAPLALRNKVIIGISGGEYGIRGFLDAYDAQSGRAAVTTCMPNRCWRWTPRAANSNGIFSSRRTTRTIGTRTTPPC